MPAQGKHRRPRSNALTRGIIAAGTGGAALALPLTVATTANAAAPAQAATSVQSAPQSAPAAAQPASRTYTVVSGDTLSSIARKHHTKGGWQRLYKDNRTTIGDNPALIRPGLKLKVNATKSSTAQKSSTASTASTATQASVKTYANNLDGWIRESLDIMAQKGIPGTYNGIYRNIIRESSGNPQAINNWDSNAAAGTPSKGLLQVIDPTFAAYHVSGTPYDPYDPVANITAACNYAADRYGSIDNVFGAY
ncbi:LysM peptidoglycan-binding domain-containing protein [Streptomyces europaeiscabiei]|uniref:LysM peptidoglycan-binding domain-containing protein n=1 Tax=Streptomyces europaeiscabiei TaxID=146819 RepID=A0ABU4NVM4_9ACTN|nr:LysM peptidoglycan-binding domain-containing protein [Streptomyces europaeiscabiei]MDX2531107.1 LysM peptidoglycan-binding domain-containing protein [Streptomyces europaeiscabiei]MDX2765511.1 LysM peptidoglycan-binding domain-containing protein [Streptomyces europaeiscabiei]MDX2774847.1 LysM peptidoglycan-binding domain-containing protein [Streptomyces europaeiscabiei]MDX3548618.1 LysM peptidoglycan-binding domain-containing protein [Streptomyces europaeiscabiei]MDX3558031.1 LysM peptidogly